METIKLHLRKAAERTIVRYLVVGGLSYVAELSVLLGIIHIAGASRTVATAISFWVGLIVAFILQKLVAFKDYSKEKKALGRQGIAYAILVVVNYAFTIAVVGLFSAKLVIVSRTVALIITTGWNYVIYKKIIFRNNVENPV